LTWLLEPFIPRRGQGHQPDFLLLASVGILLILGLFFLSSASSTAAFYKYGDSYFYVKQQLTHGLLFGLIIFYIAVRIDYQFYRKIAPVFLILSFILLSLVLITNLSNDYGTARSWIVFGSYSFQPSELVKLLFILFLAAWFERLGQRIKYFSSGTLPFLIILGILSFLIAWQPDIGTLLIIVLVALVMYWLAGASWRHLGAILALGAILFTILIKTAPYRLNRLVAWLNPNIDPEGIGWQIKQSIIAVGSGGWLGLGLGSSRQKSYLPQPANDSIFSIIAEEMGFIFCLFFIALFVFLVYRGFKIARNAPDVLAKLTALGISSWLAIQVLINIGGMLQVMPLTGVPLSFISLGGSNLVVTLAAVGIMTNISKFSSYEA